MTGVWQHIGETMAKRSKLPAWLLTFVVSLLPIYVAPNLKVSALWIAPVCLVIIYTLWISFAATQDALDRANEDRLPSVVSVHSQGNVRILLLQASKLYGQGMGVSIYHEEQTGFELFVADGRVRNIQDNGLIQVEITRWEAPDQGLLDRLIRQESGTMQQIMVKPAVVVEREAISADELIRLLSARSGFTEEAAE